MTSDEYNKKHKVTKLHKKYFDEKCYFYNVTDNLRV